MQADATRSLQLEHVCSVGASCCTLYEEKCTSLIFNSWLCGFFFFLGGPSEGPGCVGRPRCLPPAPRNVLVALRKPLVAGSPGNVAGAEQRGGGAAAEATKLGAARGCRLGPAGAESSGREGAPSRAVSTPFPRGHGGRPGPEAAAGGGRGGPGRLSVPVGLRADAAAAAGLGAREGGLRARPGTGESPVPAAARGRLGTRAPSALTAAPPQVSGPAGEETDAVLILEKTPFREEEIGELLRRHAKLELQTRNDIYSTYRLYPPPELSGECGLCGAPGPPSGASPALAGEALRRLGVAPCWELRAAGRAPGAGRPPYRAAGAWCGQDTGGLLGCRTALPSCSAYAFGPPGPSWQSCSRSVFLWGCPKPSAAPCRPAS